MKVVEHWEEMWRPEYSATRQEGWIDALTKEADVPTRAFNRLRRAEAELDKARAAVGKYFEEEIT